MRPVSHVELELLLGYVVGRLAARGCSDRRIRRLVRDAILGMARQRTPAPEQATRP